MYYTLSMILTSFFSYLAIIAGLIVGSFLNVCIYRIPRKVFWQSHRSFCIQCQQKIPFWLNVPVISFLYLRGKTSCCQSKISWRYPLVEILTGSVFLILFWNYPFLSYKYNLYTFHYNEFIRFSHITIFSCIMIICSFIDVEHMIIPDVISLPMIIITPVVVFLHPELSWKSSVLGVLLGAGCIYTIAWIYFLIRKQEGIGMGDAKLLAVVGGWLGYEAVFPTLLYSSILGSIIGIFCLLITKRKSLNLHIPFGPFIALAAVCYQLSSLNFYELWLK